MQAIGISIETLTIFILSCIKYWSYRHKTEYIVNTKYHFMNKLNNYLILYLTNLALKYFDIIIITDETWMFLFKFGLVPEMVSHTILINN